MRLCHGLLVQWSRSLRQRRRADGPARPVAAVRRPGRHKTGGVEHRSRPGTWRAVFPVTGRGFRRLLHRGSRILRLKQEFHRVVLHSARALASRFCAACAFMLRRMRRSECSASDQMSTSLRHGSWRRHGAASAYYAQFPGNMPLSGRTFSVFGGFRRSIHR